MRSVTLAPAGALAHDGKRSIDDVEPGDTVLVFTKRRFVDADANTGHDCDR